MTESKVKPKFTSNALRVLQTRYLKKNEARQVIETPRQMFERVAKNIAAADRLYDSRADVAVTAREFYELMASLEFLPNSPTLMNAGTPLQQLAACYVLPVEDDMRSIFDAVKHMALIQQGGGGTGFSFSRLRPKNDLVRTSMGLASGPVSFMRAFNAATDVIKQGGRRKGANMGMLRVDHPDILEFVKAKEKEGEFSNFNISVGITDEFMRALKRGSDYALVNPRTKKVVGRLNARAVFRTIAETAWKNGEPGVVFIDTVNAVNPTPALGAIESTNPCGEQPLLPYESCTLGSINLLKTLCEGPGGKEVDWQKLKKTVWTAVHFLDNVVDASRSPVKQVDEVTRGNRKIGLGVMGFADFLVELGISYASAEAVETAEEVMSFVQKESKAASAALAQKRGVFPNYTKSVYARKGPRLRNATTTTIAPAGTLSIIAGCSSGIEPFFGIAFTRTVLDGVVLPETNRLFEKTAKKRGFYSKSLMNKIAALGSAQSLKEVPAEVRKLFVTAQDIPFQQHALIQAAFQKHVDNAVSKTINFAYNASPRDVEKAFLLAYELHCKGVAVYRNKSRTEQVLSRGSSKASYSEP